MWFILDNPDYLVTTDIKEAFDSLDHDFLNKFLTTFGFNEYLYTGWKYY